MAYLRIGKQWEGAELIESGNCGLVAVCSGLGHYELRGLIKSPLAVLAVVTALKVILFAGTVHAFWGAIAGGGLMKLFLGSVIVGIVGCYVVFGFYPLVFGEFVDDRLKIIPVSSEESELLNRYAVNGAPVMESVKETELTED